MAEKSWRKRLARSTAPASSCACSRLRLAPTALSPATSVPSSSASLARARDTTSAGKDALSATWMPNDWSHAPSLIWYSMVRRPDAGSTTALTWRLATPTLPVISVSSWKWVANSVGAPTLSMMCSEMAHASPKPSYVEVPRPSSSMMTSEEEVAPLRMAAVSSISAMKVDTPRCWQSPAPTRAKMASRTEMRAASHATKQPA
mmetsp:Transcript_16291/g.40540  ORF Transcript_16291/g.40540 Transcript_16291/m.40540 type:complete len:203 (+) Transcript_16291:582-1190(+)